MHPWSYCVNGVSREVNQDISVLPIFYGCGFVATLQSLVEVRFEKPSEQEPVKTRLVGSSAAFF